MPGEDLLTATEGNQEHKTCRNVILIMKLLRKICLLMLKWLTVDTYFLYKTVAPRRRRLVLLVPKVYLGGGGIKKV